jgi:large subunit ribosomal protein L1
MGKKKITTIDDSSPVADAPKKGAKAKKTIFKWETAYAELHPKTAEALREARLKPDQITTMADGELLAVEGITPSGLEELRLHYPASLVDTTPQPTGKEKKAKKDKVDQDASADSPASKKNAHPKSKYPRTTQGRSATYQAKKDLLKVEIYPVSTAVKMLREISYSSHKTVELHLNTRDVGIRGELTLPHSIGKETKVAIFTPALAASIKAGKVDFDILLAKPEDMSAIAPLARVLGPRGLMPNPKSNTIIANPEKRKAELEKGATLTYRTEAKNPIIHLTIGNLDQKDKELIENLTTILTSIGATKIKSAFLKSTMSPSIKLELSSL